MRITELINAECLAGDRYRLKDAPVQAWGDFRAFTPPGSDPALAVNLERFHSPWETVAGRRAGDEALREVVRRAAALGYNAFLCDGIPAHGGGIYAKKAHQGD